MEAKASPEKDKFGQMGVLTWVTNQNIRDLKEAVNKYVQDAPDKEDSLIKRLLALNDQLHEIWKSLNPS
jgi:hypothetical protein